MEMKKWFRNWVLGLSIAILIFIALFYFIVWQLSHQNNELKNPITINEARILTSESLQLLEETLADNIISEVEKIRLTKSANSSRFILYYCTLDGHVKYCSDVMEQKSLFDYRYDLHYELFEDQITHQFKIAFPVLDQKGIQIGNALFFIPKNLLLKHNSYPLIYLILAPVLLYILLGIFIMLHNKKRKEEYDRPLNYMKIGIENILNDSFSPIPEITKKNPDSINAKQLYSEFQQMYLYIEHMNHTNKQSQTAQRELISNISHDIKTPLTTINAYVDAILTGVCPDFNSVIQYVSVIQVHSNKMVKLVNDLFYHSLQQLGHISVEPTASYSKDVFSKIIPILKQMVSAKMIQWIEPQEIPNVLIHVDAGRIEQVMTNLVQNSIKHTPEGGLIQISFAIEDNLFKTSIIDNGEGILVEDIPYIFDRYYQGQYNKKQKNDGAGLGLSICKYIIDLHDGEIFFKTMKEEGTKFYFILPIC